MIRLEGAHVENRSKGGFTRDSVNVQIVNSYPIRDMSHRKITQSTMERFGVRSEIDEMDGTVKAVYYPYHDHDGTVVGYKKRMLPKEFSVVGKIKGLFGQAQCKNNAKLLILVEGEQDCLAGWEILKKKGKAWNICSLPNGANEEGTLDTTTLKELEWIVKHEKVLLMLDNDAPGKATAKALADALCSQTSVAIASLPRKDTGKCLEDGIEDDWFNCIYGCKAYHPEEIVEGKDLDFTRLRKAKKPGVEMPFPKLQKMTWGLRKGEITLVTAACVDADTEFLSQRGWKRIADYQEGDDVLCYSATGIAELHKPSAYIKEASQTLTRFNTRYGVDQVLSDEHTVIYINKNGSLLKRPFSEIKASHEKSNDGWQGRFITSFWHSGPGIDMTEGDIRLQVAVMADGRIVKEGKDNYTQMRFRKKRKYDRLISLCQKYNLRYKDMTKEGGDYEVIVWPKTDEKWFTERYYSCTLDQMGFIIDEIRYWDGTEAGALSTTKKETADFIQFAYACAGVRATISEDHRKDKYVDGYCATVYPTKNNLVGITNRHNKVEMEEYKTVDGFKYCFTTPTGMWVARRNGNIFVTGNSGIGKSTFVKELAYHVAKSGHSVANIALETQMEDVAMSYIAMDNNVPAYRYIFNTDVIKDEDYEASVDWMFRSNRMHFFKHWGSINPDTLRAKMLYFAKVLKVDFIVLDHVSMVIAGNESDNERKDIDKLFEAMTQICVETGVGIIPIIHLKRVQNKKLNHGDEVELTDLRGSAGAEQMSFNVWALERNQQGDDKDLVKIRVLKNRSIGFTGLADTLQYNHETGRLKLFSFEEFERNEDRN
jgi:replicative DNA helicase/5S rRNA maturation endonuclease (ribonuclease M5)